MTKGPDVRFDDVLKACSTLIEKGKTYETITIEEVLAITGGSKSTVQPYLKLLKELHRSAKVFGELEPEFETLLKAFLLKEVTRKIGVVEEFRNMDKTLATEKIDELVDVMAERDSLHVELLEANERWSKESQEIKVHADLLEAQNIELQATVKDKDAKLLDSVKESEELKHKLQDALKRVEQVPVLQEKIDQEIQKRLELEKALSVSEATREGLVQRIVDKDAYIADYDKRGQEMKSTIERLTTERDNEKRARCDAEENLRAFLLRTTPEPPKPLKGSSSKIKVM